MENGENKFLCNYGPGDAFGELALLERKKRTETVKTIEPTILYELDGKTFRDIVKTINKNELIERLKFISLVPIFSSLESIQLNSLASSMFKMTFDEGQYVFYEKDVGDSEDINSALFNLYTEYLLTLYLTFPLLITFSYAKSLTK